MVGLLAPEALFGARRVAPELMDEEDRLTADELEQAHRGLRRIHAISGTFSSFWNPIHLFLEKTKNRNSGKEFTICDLGCGRGDLLAKLLVQLRLQGCHAHGLGLDFNLKTLELARERHPELEFAPWDARTEPLPAKPDIVIASLFLHHFSTEHVGQILRSVQAADPALVVISDLHRTLVGYVLAEVGCTFLSQSRLVRNDGPRSVLNAFHETELHALFVQAGFQDFELERRWPQRLQVIWERDGSQHSQ